MEKFYSIEQAAEYIKVSVEVLNRFLANKSGMIVNGRVNMAELNAAIDRECEKANCAHMKYIQEG
jgi:hypothetical protein